jgi:hypothetical protein
VHFYKTTKLFAEIFSCETFGVLLEKCYLCRRFFNHKQTKGYKNRYEKGNDNSHARHDDYGSDGADCG